MKRRNNQNILLKRNQTAISAINIVIEIERGICSRHFDRREKQNNGQSKSVEFKIRLGSVNRIGPEMGRPSGLADGP